MISPLLILILAQRLYANPCLVPTEIDHVAQREEWSPITGSTQVQHYDVLEVIIDGHVYTYVEMRLTNASGSMEEDVRATSILMDGERMYASLPSHDAIPRVRPSYCSLPIVTPYP